jgi:hypothetical protein
MRHTPIGQCLTGRNAEGYLCGTQHTHPPVRLSSIGDNRDGDTLAVTLAPFKCHIFNLCDDAIGILLQSSRVCILEDITHMQSKPGMHFREYHIRVELSRHG